MPPIIEVKNLTCRYGSLTAVDDVSFTVEKGSLFAFLGPNGAGKSTTISALIDHHGPAACTIRGRIGVVFQDSLLDAPLTVAANLRSRGKLYGLDDIAPVVRLLRLDDILTRRYGTLSGGQRRRVDIARALLGSPDILFLDEPTTGLDPQSRNLVWDTIGELRRRLGLTVFLTSHYMEEAEQADQVAIIDHGKIIASGTPAQLRAAYSRDRVRRRAPTMNDVFLTLTGTGLRED